ncbi:DUF6746 family protein [Thiomicrospira sp. WB1]|uniref:DUF6746 family protein n=1 Tax=Thiomicrospira sp. WB1 TaxID=1685380 RepID=UPI0008397013|nr:DUF6746 family protein [Thiomicrospira sp. WB1]
MKSIKQWALACLAGNLMAGMAWASDDEHFEGLKPATYAQAQAYLREYNAKLAALAEDGTINPAEMGEIHQLTYTLENSLERMEEEMERIEEVLERVHQGSEHGEYDAVLKHTHDYLDASDVLITQ